MPNKSCGVAFDPDPKGRVPSTSALMPTRLRLLGQEKWCSAVRFEKSLDSGWEGAQLHESAPAQCQKSSWLAAGALLHSRTPHKKNKSTASPFIRAGLSSREGSRTARQGGQRLLIGAAPRPLGRLLSIHRRRARGRLRGGAARPPDPRRGRSRRHPPPHRSWPPPHPPPRLPRRGVRAECRLAPGTRVLRVFRRPVWPCLSATLSLSPSLLANRVPGHLR